MRYFKLLMTLMLVCASVAAEEQKDDDLTAIIKASKKAIEKNKSDELKKWLDESVSRSKEFQKESRKIANSSKPGGMVDITLPFEAEAEKWAEEFNIKDDSYNSPESATNYIFISFSMGDSAIKRLLKESVERDEESVFIFQGWKPPHFQQMFQRIGALLPHQDNSKRLPTLIIEPDLYTKMKVDAVPQYLVKREDDVWVHVKGALSIEDAHSKSYLPTETLASEVFGTMYEIEEPNMIALIKERLANHDWEADVERIKKGIYETKSSVALPTAIKDVTYFVDPTITVKQNIPATEGRFIARKGQRVNPLEYMTLSKDYVIFDPSDLSQKAYVKEYLRKKPYSSLIVTQFPSNSKSMAELENLFKRPIKELNKLIVKRFELKEVPSIVSQEGMLLKVTVKGMKL